MEAKIMYAHLDAIKLALETSATLLGIQVVREIDGEVTSNISEENCRSINATIHVAEKALRDILNNELEDLNHDKEENN